MAEPLTIHTALFSWRFDLQLVLIFALCTTYWWASGVAARRGQDVGPARRSSFLIIGGAVWVVASASFVGVYAGELFWVRALQIVLLLFVVPMGLAAGKPMTVLYAAVGGRGRRRVDAMLASTLARVVTYPAVTSVAMLAVPWLLYLTGWYEASLQNTTLDQLTRMLLVVIGFGYFYSRLQADPVPRRFSQMISLVITTVEVIGDALLGIVIWQGPLIALEYYEALGRTWGPDLRMDQTIGAGVLWILGDVAGLPFLLALMLAFRADEQKRAEEVDAALDAGEGEPTSPPGPSPVADQAPGQPEQHTLWWENDPQLRERYHR